MSESLIPLELAKAHLRLGDDGSMDTLVAEYLRMAEGIASDYVNRDLGSEFTSETLPPAIKSAVLLILGTLFDNESDALVGRSVSELPMSAERLLQPWRVHPYGMTDEDAAKNGSTSYGKTTDNKTTEGGSNEGKSDDGIQGKVVFGNGEGSADSPSRQPRVTATIQGP